MLKQNRDSPVLQFYKVIKHMVSYYAAVVLKTENFSFGRKRYQDNFAVKFIIVHLQNFPLK